jgi:hypothetical protein
MFSDMFTRARDQVLAQLPPRWYPAERFTAGRADARFDPGRVMVSAAAACAMRRAGASPGSLMARHLRGDWGDADDRDRRANEDSLARGEGGFQSLYPLGTGDVVAVGTLYDRATSYMVLTDEL